MDKSKVISLLQDNKQDDRAKYAALVMALNQAKTKNLSLLSYYNRVGFSSKNLKSIEYDIKKTYSITSSDMSVKQKPVSKEVKEASKHEQSKTKKEQSTEATDEGKMHLEKLNDELRETDLEKASYADLKSLAHDLANELNYEFENQKKATYLAFLTAQKKSLSNES